ncbi:MAG TPA: hypothetical protein VEZ15_08455 [Acidimicrobiia bacterium]|nr:hypothetical protein [Acidimicrobiia bacterium]
MRVAALMWFAYAALAGVGMGLKSVPFSVAGSVFYLVPMVLVYRLFSPADTTVALALLPIEGLACGIQAAGQIRDDKDLQKLALVVFALGFVVLGYLVARSDLLPPFVGYAMIAGAVAWGVAMIPGMPLPVALPLQLLGFASEGLFVIWMLVAG